MSESTCVGFEEALASKLEPIWHQMAPKHDPKTNQKKYPFCCKDSGFILNWFWNSIWGIKGGGGGSNSGCVRCFFGSWGFFEAKMVPRSSRAASKADSGASSIVFNEILVGGFSLQLWCVGLLVCWSCGAIAWLVCLIFGCWVFLFQARWRAKPLAIGYHFVSRTQYINLYIYVYHGVRFHKSDD